MEFFSGSIPPKFAYVSINKDLEKLPPQLFQIQMKICYDQGCNFIELSQQRNDAITYCTSSRISWYWAFFFSPKSFTRSFCLQQLPRCSRSLSQICGNVMEILWNEAVTKNAFKICRNVSYCCPQKYETRKRYS